MTKRFGWKYNKKNEEPVKCRCGKIVAFERNGILYLYCKKCKRSFPYAKTKREPEPESLSH